MTSSIYRSKSYSEISILLDLEIITNLNFIECPLEPISNKRSRFYRPFADGQLLNKIEISLYYNCRYIYRKLIIKRSVKFELSFWSSKEKKEKNSFYLYVRVYIPIF